MPIPTNAEILTLLDRLDRQTANDLESQWLELKPWSGPKDDMRIAVEYAVCFANADGGVVVFGVADKLRGRTAAIHGAGGWSGGVPNLRGGRPRHLVSVVGEHRKRRGRNLA